jgi:hypothetical protein
MKSGTHDRPDYDPGNLAGFRSGGSMNIYASALMMGAAEAAIAPLRQLRKYISTPVALSGG